MSTTYAKLLEYQYVFLNSKTYTQIETQNFYIECSTSIASSSVLQSASCILLNGSAAITSTTTTTSDSVKAYIESADITSNTNVSINALNTIYESTDIDSSSKLINLPMKFEDAISYDSLNKLRYFSLENGNIIKLLIVENTVINSNAEMASSCITGLVQNITINSNTTVEANHFNVMLLDITIDSIAGMFSTVGLQAATEVYGSFEIQSNTSLTIDTILNKFGTTYINCNTQNNFDSMLCKFMDISMNCSTNINAVCIVLKTRKNVFRRNAEINKKYKCSIGG